ncbi:ABC transporter ATP-binding protein [Shimia sediminis]|uniref:ABC transporter ATP-binding protein n=1 Tax=Shimia sediminis TaxID=2497945 RepID=UPI0019825985|nr:ABC transporter ATP-binding protein [Shimia sediminis]
MSDLLNVQNLSVRYGAIQAIENIDLTISEGQVVALIGPNGAGKSSLVNAIAGNVRGTSGDMTFLTSPLLGVKPEDRVRLGISLVPEGRHVFSGFSVLENLWLGATTRKDRVQARQEIEEFLELFPILGKRRDGLAGMLSGGEQQQLVIARALLAKPKLLMLDEPSLGLAPLVVDQVYDLIRDVRKRGISVLVVEQSTARCFEVADQVHVLNHGKISMSGTPAEMGDAARFEAAYFGVSGEIRT